MDLISKAFRHLLCFLLLLTFFGSCTPPSWFPIKPGPPHRAKTKDLIDKEIILVDGEEYIKVVDPRSSSEATRTRYTYIPVTEYLSNRANYVPATAKLVEKDEKSRLSLLLPKSAEPPEKKEETVETPLRPSVPLLRKKILLAFLEDRTNPSEERFGDWIMAKLMNELERKSSEIVTVDYETVQDLLSPYAIAIGDIGKKQHLQLLSEKLGIHAVLAGTSYGPYVFSTRTSSEQDSTSSAIARVEVKLYDSLSGKLIKEFSVSNPFTSVSVKGPFSEERARLRAVELTLAEVTRSLLSEINTLAWYCRIIKIAGDEVYLNAGKLSGLKVGDILEVYARGTDAGKSGLKGRVEVTTFLGIDASVAKPIEGRKPDLHDVVKLLERRGT